MDLNTYGTLVAVLIGLAVLWPFVKAQARKSALEVAEKERDIEREARLAHEERCKQEIAELRGQLNAATIGFAKVIAVEIIRAMKAEGVIKDGS